MEEREFITKNAAETQKLAGQIAKEVLAEKRRKSALVLALEGELGGGKTTFVQGLAKELGVKERILSPTFVIMKHFKIVSSFPGLASAQPKAGKFQVSNLYHIDCYRLDKPEDLIDLGLREILKDPKNLIVIEWADKVKSIIPKDAVWVKFKWVGEEERKIVLRMSNF